jgi:hypothetical protein
MWLDHKIGKKKKKTPGETYWLNNMVISEILNKIKFWKSGNIGAIFFSPTQILHTDHTGLILSHLTPPKNQKMN